VWSNEKYTVVIGYWLQAIESDLAPFNIGLATTYHRAQNQQAWSILVVMATFITGQAT